jgi:hypothetical protein
MAKKRATAQKKAVRKAPATKAAKKAARKTAKKAARKTAKKAPARKAAKKAARKAPAAKTKKAARKVARKPAARKTAAKRTTAKNATARKAAPRKAPARATASTATRKAARPGRARPAPIRGAIPSSLDLGGGASAARSGREELLQHIKERTETSPAITAGDVDADWQQAYSSGDEAPGGDNPTPDQDVVDEIGEALGVEYDDDEELKGAAKIEARDKHRWELDPASKEDLDEE